MKAFVLVGVLGVLDCGCASSEPFAGSASSASTTTSSGSGASGGDGGVLGSKIGDGCNPSSVSDACVSGGLVCDATTGTCRLPGLDEECVAGVGCAAWPPDLSCYDVGIRGAPGARCLVPCTTTDSSGCPYGTSCGDQNLEGFCSAQGTPACIPWGRCTLGAGLLGDCVPDGDHTRCLATGSQTLRYGPCDPSALNDQSAKLCAQGSVCLPAAGTLGAPPTAGFCFPLCGPDGGTCLSDSEHCDEPSPGVYGTCRPGIACTLNPDVCPDGMVCVPDDPSGLAGGCLPVAPDAGGLGSECAPLSTVADVSVCAAGACLPTGVADGGYTCSALCNLADGGRPYCVGQSCAPLNVGDATEVVGTCR